MGCQGLFKPVAFVQDGYRSRIRSRTTAQNSRYTTADADSPVEVAAFFSYANKLTQAIGLQPDATLFG